MSSLIKKFRALPERRKSTLVTAGIFAAMLFWCFVSTYLEVSKLEEQMQYMKSHREFRVKMIPKEQYDSDSWASVVHMIALMCGIFFVLRIVATRKRGEHLLLNRPKALMTFTVHASREVAMNDIAAIAQQLGLRIERLDLEKGTFVLGDDRRVLIDWGWYLAVYIEDFQIGSVTISIGAENKIKKAIAHASALTVQQKFLNEVRSYIISKDRKIA